jgi:folate-dependent phosphoribosylglycinamide formyltransferase PurN
MMETPSTTSNTFIWCTYRDWSFRVLDGLLDVSGWSCSLIVTTLDCRSDLSRFEKRGIELIRIDGRKDLKEGERGHNAIAALRPNAIFHYGWSWLVPQGVLDLCPNVTLHPGKLPKDRGGSPIQNQIRHGETWSYANLIQLAPGLDEGPIYLRERFSLEGDDADAMWSRMTATGAMLARQFLAGLAAGTLKPEPQDNGVEPAVYKRVRPEAACLCPETQTARAMYDIVRAHNETDANTYVVKAWLDTGQYRLVIDRAGIGAPSLAVNGRSWNLLAEAWCEDRLFDVAFRVNNGDDSAFIAGCDGIPLFLTRFYVVCR